MQPCQHLDFSWWDPSWTSDYTEVSHLVRPAHKEKAFFNGADTRRWDQWNHPYHNCTFDGWQYFKKFWVSRGCRRWEDPGLWQIDWIEFSDWNDADSIKPWAVSPELQSVNMSRTVGYGKCVWKSTSYHPSAFCGCVLQKQLWARG